MKKPVLSSLAPSLRPALALKALALTAGLALAGQAQAQTQVYQHWPLKASAQDSAAVRAGVTASTPTLKRLVVSDGSATANARPYSSIYGQAIAPVAVGTGWSSSLTPPGPGGTLKRTFYEQFTVTAAAGQTVRADSLILTAGFLGTASGTNLGVVYSLTNFTTADSTSGNITGGKGPAGVLPATANGSFATPIGLLQVPGGSVSSNTYRLALNGTTGITLNAGQALTIRVYFSCSSTGASARFALLKDVIVKSRQTVASSRSRNVLQLAAYPNPTQDQLQILHPATPKAGAVTVYSATGRQVAAFATQAGTTATSLPLAKLPAGIYLVEYQNGLDRMTSRIVKE
jgi:pectinesterase